VYTILEGRTAEKTPLRRSKCRWEEGFKMDLWETSWEDMEWIHLAQVGTGSGLL
jgi:hypothetical protein